MDIDTKNITNRRALSALYAKFKSAGGMAYDVYTKLYQSFVEPVLFYCAGIWGLTDTVQNKACKYFLGVGQNASNVATRGDMLRQTEARELSLILNAYKYCRQ